MNQRSSSLIISLQLLVAFALGIFGNKVSELINIKPLYTVVIVIFLLLISLLLLIPREIFKVNKIQKIINNNKVIIIPLFFFVGFFISMIIIKLFDYLSITTSFGFTYYVNQDDGVETFAFLYEIICYLILAILVWYNRKENLDLRKLFISSIGATSGVATSIMYFKPLDNTPLYTFIGGLIICFLIISVIEFLYNFKLQRKSNTPSNARLRRFNY
jgi:uncharacterized membrane protein YfcA